MAQLIIPGEHARVIELDERTVAALLKQFRATFGRDPGPNDPIFFDPDITDKPTPITAVKIAEYWRQIEDATGIENVAERMEAHSANVRAMQEEHGLSRKIGRNDPCPCGSGVKFKRCHGSR